MGIITYFFDTYAFYEIIKGNQNYSPYKKDISIITTKLNLMELHYALLRVYDKETAESYYEEFLPLTIEVDDEIIKTSNLFKFENKEKKLSYIDCIGYTLSKKLGIKFLTGDKQFENLDNVEFVK